MAPLIVPPAVRSTFLFFAFGLISVVAAAPTAYCDSFDSVYKRVYSDPLTKMPVYGTAFRAILNAALKMSGELIDRARVTLADHSDFKPAAVKIIHPVGVCAQGIWKINRPSFSTGLLSPKPDGNPTSLRAIVRFSIATNQPSYDPAKPNASRNFGIAIKLFPSESSAEDVTTENVFTLDQTGLDGDNRRSFFFSDGNGPNSVYFTNDVLGKNPRSTLAVLGQITFQRIDRPSTFRALYPLAEKMPDGSRVKTPMAPRLIRFVPRMARPSTPPPLDFRHEILAYQNQPIIFDIVLPAENYGITKDLTIGSLVVTDPVVSDVCDRELTFHHSPENRKLDTPAEATVQENP